MEDDTIYARDLDGSMHICAKGDPGAVAYVPAGTDYPVCPNCGAKALVPPFVISHVDAFGVPATFRMECCKGLAKVKPVRSYLITSYFGVGEDEWSEEYKHP